MPNHARDAFMLFRSDNGRDPKFKAYFKTQFDALGATKADILPLLWKLCWEMWINMSREEQQPYFDRAFILQKQYEGRYATPGSVPNHPMLVNGLGGPHMNHPPNGAINIAITPMNRPVAVPQAVSNLGHEVACSGNEGGPRTVRNPGTIIAYAPYTHPRAHPNSSGQQFVARPHPVPVYGLVYVPLRGYMTPHGNGQINTPARQNPHMHHSQAMILQPRVPNQARQLGLVFAIPKNPPISTQAENSHVHQRQISVPGIHDINQPNPAQAHTKKSTIFSQAQATEISSRVHVLRDDAEDISQPQYSESDAESSNETLIDVSFSDTNHPVCIPEITLSMLMSKD